MGLVIWFILGVIFAIWSHSLAVAKSKPTPMGWAILGFFFNLLPVIALYAVHSKSELIDLTRPYDDQSSNYDNLKFEQREPETQD